MLALSFLADEVRAEGESTAGTPWVVFVRVVGAPSGTEARLVSAVSGALLRSDANVVDSAELVKAAAARGVARTRWADVGALNSVAKDIGADFLLFATVRGAELELFTLSKSGEIGGAERLALGRRAAPPDAAELDDALAKLLAKLPHSVSAPAAAAPAAPPPAPQPPSAPSAVAAPSPMLATPSAPPAPAVDPAGAMSSRGPSPLKLGLLGGSALLGAAAGMSLAYGVVTGMDAMAQSDSLLVLPKGSPVRSERERVALDTAALADAGWGASAVLLAGAAGLGVWALMAE